MSIEWKKVEEEDVCRLGMDEDIVLSRERERETRICSQFLSCFIAETHARASQFMQGWTLIRADVFIFLAKGYPYIDVIITNFVVEFLIRIRICIPSPPWLYNHQVINRDVSTYHYCCSLRNNWRFLRRVQSRVQLGESLNLNLQIFLTYEKEWRKFQDYY